MDIQTLIRNATAEEIPAIAAAVKRASDRPAILVTTSLSRGRCYVVRQEDEHLLEELIGLSGEQLADAVRSSGDHLGAQWLRSMGRVDEIHRTLTIRELTSVKSADRARVWGEPRTRITPRGARR